jgi:hypothetical protein
MTLFQTDALVATGAGMLLFDRRLGCLDTKMNTGAMEYIDAFNQMLSSSMKLIVGEKLHQKLNTKIWQQHSQAWDKILSTGMRYIRRDVDDSCCLHVLWSD